jgi:hypothetical protein
LEKTEENPPEFEDYESEAVSEKKNESEKTEEKPFSFPFL